MKRITSLMGSFLLITLIGTQVGFAQELRPTGFYVRLHGGAGVAQDVEVRQFVSTPGVRGLDMELKPGVTMDLGGGYQATPWFAAELQTGYTYNTIDRIKGAPQVYFHESRISTVPIMVNAIFQIPNDTPFLPYAGVGIGGSLNVLYADDIVTYTGPYRGFVLDGSDAEMVFGYQFYAGLRYRLNPQMEVNLGYRFLGTKETEWDVDTYFYPPVSGIGIEGMAIHSATLSFLYRF